MNTQAEVQRIVRLLEAAFRVSKVPLRAFERKIGMGSGTLSRIFRGEIELKLRHVFDVLSGLGIPAEEFFALAYRKTTSRGEDLARDVMTLLEDHLPSPAAEEPAEEPPGISEDELDRRIQEALRKYGVIPRRRRNPKSTDGP